VALKQVQELAEALSLRPVEGERSIALLPEGQHVNVEGWNALLKLLEEPPPGTTFLIGTDNREAVPETVRSRCQAIRFAPLREEVLVEILTGTASLSEADARAAASLAGGSVGRALRLAVAGLPARLPRIVGLLESEPDPVAVNEALAADVPAAGERREPLAAARSRAEDLVRLVAEATRRRFLAERRDATAAGFCLDAAARALDNLRLNLAPDAVLLTFLTEILPRWQTPRPS
jgi:DNA polymerase-3 subunit delta'